MTKDQARALGHLISKARRARGMSKRQLALEIGAANGWIVHLEHGLYLAPSPERLARIAEVLNIDPTRINLLTRGAVADGLPEMRAYFRAKYDLTPEDIEKVERYVERLRRAA